MHADSVHSSNHDCFQPVNLTGICNKIEHNDAHWDALLSTLALAFLKRAGCGALLQSYEHQHTTTGKNDDDDDNDHTVVVIDDDATAPTLLPCTKLDQLTNLL